MSKEQVLSIVAYDKELTLYPLLNNDEYNKMNKQLNIEKIFQNKTKVNVESYGVTYKELPFYGARLNGFIDTLHVAYSNHYEVTLSPDDIWVCIVQGLSYYINENMELLRDKFVDFDGKKVLKIYRNDFIKGQQNDWEGAFAEFSDLIQKEIGVENHKTIIGDFSTTGPIEKCVSEIVLMDSMKQLFNYECYTLCGIPKINLLGIKEDWQKIYSKVENFKTYSKDGVNLNWWTEKLLPILQKFIDAYDGKIDSEFWKCIYKEPGGSGGIRSSGWCNVFFPYILDYDKNIVKSKYFTNDNPFSGISVDSFPSGINKVPFKWFYYAEVYDCVFLGGFLGFVILNGNSLKPVMAWGMGENTEVETDREKEIKQIQLKREAAKQKQRDELIQSLSTPDSDMNVMVYSVSRRQLIKRAYVNEYSHSLRWVKLLNDLLEKDQKALTDLVNHMVPVNDAIENNTVVITINMRKDNQNVPALRMLGIVNGYLSMIDSNKICMHLKNNYSNDIDEIDYFSVVIE